MLGVSSAEVSGATRRVPFAVVVHPDAVDVVAFGVVLFGAAVAESGAMLGQGGDEADAEEEGRRAAAGSRQGTGSRGAAEERHDCTIGSAGARLNGWKVKNRGRFPGAASRHARPVARA